MMLSHYKMGGTGLGYGADPGAYLVNTWRSLSLGNFRWCYVVCAVMNDTQEAQPIAYVSDVTELSAVGCFLFFFKQKTAYDNTVWLEFRRVLFRSMNFLSNLATFPIVPAITNRISFSINFDLCKISFVSKSMKLDGLVSTLLSLIFSALMNLILP